jgi:hypothetical protein
MDLHEWGAAPALNELSDTKQAPNQCVVLGANQVVGYFDVDDLKIPHATRVEQRGVPQTILKYFLLKTEQLGMAQPNDDLLAGSIGWSRRISAK